MKLNFLAPLHLVLIAIAPDLHAVLSLHEVVIDTTAAWSGGGAASLGGSGGVAAHGQVVTVPENATSLESFTFFVDEHNNENPVSVRGYVVAWVDQFFPELSRTLTRATGDILFQSEVFTTDGTRGSYQEIEVATGGLSLVGGGEYLIFLSVHGLYEADADLKIGYVGSNAYSGGETRYHGSAFSPALIDSIFNTNWSTLGSPAVNDLAFRARFVDPVPEPAVGGLLAAAAIIAFARRRRHLPHHPLRCQL